MNCKPGDLAYIVGPSGMLPPFDSLVGQVVQVSDLSSAQPLIWALAKPIVIQLSQTNVEIVAVEDVYLRPITPPAPEELRIDDTFDPVFVALGIQSRTYA